MKCPRCGSRLINDWGEPYCLLCGYRREPEITPEAEEMHYKKEQELKRSMNNHIINLPKIMLRSGGIRLDRGE